MEEFQPELIEQYQKIYFEDPSSKVFATLAEAYRRMGLLQESLEVAQKGVKLHANYASGFVTLGKILSDLKQNNEAELAFINAIKLAPDNVLAHQLLAEEKIKLKKPHEAIRAYKALLFINPENEKAQLALARLTSAFNSNDNELQNFAADFEMTPLTAAAQEINSIKIESVDPSPTEKSNTKDKYLERIIGLADAFITRNNFEKAIETLNDGERLMGPHLEIVSRLRTIHLKALEPINTDLSAKPHISRGELARQDEILFLQDLLDRIKDRSTT